MDHSQHDCLIVAVLSHGELGLLYAHDTAYKADFLWQHFTADRCPTLAGKPKMFFIQACQGDKLDAGVTLKERTETDGQPTSTFRIPSQADFLIAYSTIPGIIDSSQNPTESTRRGRFSAGSTYRSSCLIVPCAFYKSLEPQRMPRKHMFPIVFDNTYESLLFFLNHCS